MSMKRFTNPDAPLMRFLRQMVELVFLNLCFLLCCIPVVTIGAARTALYGVLLRGEQDQPIRSFFRLFRRDWKQATKTYLLVMLWSGVILLDYCLSRSQGDGVMTTMSVVMLLAGFFLCMVSAWLFPLIALSENSSRGYYRDAFRLALAHLPRSLLMAVLNLIPLAFFLLYPYQFVRFGFLFVLFAFALIAKFNEPLLRGALADYLPKAESPQEEAPEETEDASAFFSRFAAEEAQNTDR